MFHCVDRGHFAYPSVCQWTLGCFHLLTIANTAAISMGIQITVFSIWFKFFFVYNQRWSCWSNGNSMFNFFKEQSHCFHVSYTILHSHQQCTKNPKFSYSHEHTCLLLQGLVLLCLVGNSHSNGCEVV